MPCLPEDIFQNSNGLKYSNYKASASRTTSSNFFPLGSAAPPQDMRRKPIHSAIKALPLVPDHKLKLEKL
jgi:hypothetical protein